jgi:transcriptional regulator with XRE-family HTH domain
MPETLPTPKPTPKPTPDRTSVRLGPALRAARRARGMTLTELASAAELSQPFLSQLELGRAQPSMRSLHRIAEALGTTQQQLLAAAAGATPGPARGRDAGGRPGAPPGEPERAASAELVSNGGGGARLLLHRPAVDVTEFVGLPAEFREWFSHGRTETLYLVRGRIEVEVRQDGRVRRTVLGERDTLAYPGRAEHRYRQLGATTAVLLVIHDGD